MTDKMNRQDFFKLGLRELGQSLLRFLPEAIVPPSPPSASARFYGLRPPGAVLEPAFSERCTSCNLCVKSCPHDALKLAEEGEGFAVGTPFLPGVSAKPCHLCEGLPCAAACPAGIMEVIPAHEVRMGTAEIDSTTCFAFAGQYCDYCIDRCPYPEEAIFADEHHRPVINPERCTGCGLCAHFCVSTPGSISIRPRLSPPGIDS